jgi:SAM-dependent methyltransferase
MAINPTGKPDYKEIVRQEWLEAAPQWKKWFTKLEQQSQAGTDLLVQGAKLAPGMQVLDVASGSGQPALCIAEVVGPQGSVTATDLVPEMLEGAAAIATSRGLRNIEFRQADSELLPFRGHEFDCITCRFGIMFFPDIRKALSEHRRVLKPQGRFSYLTWGPAEENPLFNVMLVPFLKYVKVPPPPPDAPQIFRFADPDILAGVLDAAGFHSVHVSKQKVQWPWSGSAEEAWEAAREIGAPFRTMIAALPPNKTLEVHLEVIEGIQRYSDGKRINFPASLVLATGTV